ncbi:septum formation initiator family protein [Sporomusa sp.]|uniref:FtsB family cell division protein n=1 Tax=Sporomusa sp. TaxID=2078658 RepID=UPI002D1D65E6|nr:septum formation initiator family protein [Sporomusa sp.]HWR09451.1 septum formation initiator family protein [Sporomusa sp.]
MAQKRKKTKRFSWFRLCILIMAGYFCYMIILQQTELYKIRREMDAVNTRMAEAEGVNKNLAAEKEKLSMTEYIEKVAREQLGLVKPGEVPYIPAR